MVMEDITQRTPENVPAEPQVFKRYTLDTKTEVEVRDDGVWFMENKVTKAGKAYQEAMRDGPRVCHGSANFLIRYHDACPLILEG